MNGVDLAILVLVALSAMIGVARGLVREILGLGAWIGALAAAFWLFPAVQPFGRRMIQNVDFADPASFGAIFLAVLITLSLVARGTSLLVRGSVLGSLDRTLGLLYGLGRGAAVVIIAYIAAGAVEPMDHWPDAVLEARTLPSIYLGAAWVSAHVPEVYRPALAVPPAGRATNAADLLHASPVGRASAALPSRQ